MSGPGQVSAAGLPRGAKAPLAGSEPHAMGERGGHVAIVTGAGKGLGRAYALHLAGCGVSVLVNNRRHAGEADAQTSAQQTVDAVLQAGGVACANWSDVSDPDSGQAMVKQALAAFGRLDIVVANAGIDKAASFHKQTLADFRAVFEVGFFGNLHLAHAAWPHLMQQRYGRVVLTASSAGLYADHGMAAYSAAKAAVIGLMRALAIEGHRHNVLANVIAPYAYSQMTAPYMTGDMARSFDPALVAPLVGWLCSAECDVSGEVLVSGAGLVRRASVGETPALALAPQAIARTVHALRDQPTRSYPTANVSFSRFLQEAGQLSIGTSA